MKAAKKSVSGGQEEVNEQKVIKLTTTTTRLWLHGAKP
jgi:hypothetical protein